MKFRNSRRLKRLVLLSAAVLLVACGSSTDTNGENIATPVSSAPTGSPETSSPASLGSPQLKVLSNRPDLISGGDALVEAILPSGVTADMMVISLNGQDVTYQFGIRANGRYMGVLNSLAPGTNVLTAVVAGGGQSSVTIINHLNGGPVFTGPQLQPWTCQTGATDALCNEPIQYTYLYQSTDPAKNGLQAYDPTNPATDVASTTTDQGITVPFIVRQELGYEDRNQYLILVLFQPGMLWEPWASQTQWNHKLLITHGGGVGATYGVSAAPLEDYSGTIPEVPGITESYVAALGRGFAVMSTALDDDDVNSDVALQAESLIMAKEHLIEAYGELRYTIGTGCSGGSLAQQWIANAYPGVYQGLLPTCSFPDVWSTATQVVDYDLLLAYFQNPLVSGTAAFTPVQWAAVEGNALPVDAEVSDVGYITEDGAVGPTFSCADISDAQRYDAMTNPAGVRCGVPDFSINVFAPRQPSVWTENEKRLGHGFAGLPLDNVGVQYGLSALQQGIILPSQFVDLNAKIGGLNIDINPTAGRLVADEPTLNNAYRSGSINEATNLDQVAIIDGRGPDPGAAHDVYRVFAVRARLDRAHGSHANQVIWEGPVPLIGDLYYTVNGLIALDRWLAAVEQDQSTTLTLGQKIVQDKPSDIDDQCYDGAGNKLTDTLCPSAVVAAYGTPRTVAGDDITTDANKCQLKPLNASDNYGAIPFTSDQWAQMQTIFPNGVCDYSKPGVDQQPTLPWQTYQDAEGNVVYGGRPLPVAPVGVAPGWVSGGFATGF